MAGEISDSPAALMSFLLMLVHTFSMNAVASIDYWLNLLEKEIKDIVVSKHSAHLAEVERLLKGEVFVDIFCPHQDVVRVISFPHLLLFRPCFLQTDFNSYLDPLENIMQTLSKEQEDMMMNLEDHSDEEHAEIPIRTARFSLARSNSSKSSLSKFRALVVIVVDDLRGSQRVCFSPSPRFGSFKSDFAYFYASRFPFFSAQVR